MARRTSDRPLQESPVAASADVAALSTELLRQVTEGVSLVRASDALIVFANPHFERMFGYEPGELLGQHVSVLNVPHEHDVAAEIVAVLHKHGRWEGDIANRRKDGSRFWSHLSVSTFDHAELGTVWVAVQRDVSERKRLEEELIRAKSFLDSIVDNMPDMVFVKDAENLRFVLFNRAGAELVGYPRADLIGKGDHDFFPKAEADFFNENDRVVLRGKIPLEIPEEPIDTATHGVRLLRTKKIPILDDKGVPAYLLGISEDVTERHEAEELRRRHERTMTTVNAILAGISAHVEVTAAFPEVCVGLRELTRCSSASLVLVDERREWLRWMGVDEPWSPTVVQDQRLRLSEYPGSAELLAGHTYAVRDLASIKDFSMVHYSYALGFRSTLSFPLHTGRDVIGFLTLLWKEVDGCATVDAGVLAHTTSALAIALERHRLFEQVRVGHERLAVLSRRLLTVQETERRHVARELHDEIGQYLTGVSLQLSQLDRRPPEDFHARLGELNRLVGDLIDRVRDLSLDLRPAMLDDFGLLPALRWLFERFSRQTNVAVQFAEAGLERRFSPDVETATYRIVQEALTNVARYAAVDAVAVHASAIDGRLTVVIEDRGRGFDADTELMSANTSGLSGMRERAVLLGGRLTIESSPGGGTRIRAEFDDR